MVSQPGPPAERPVIAGLHVHSTWSDGELSLGEVREVFQGLGCRVVCMADHADTFDSAKMRDYVTECRELSGPGFRMLPGLEFSCRGRMHIVGYGVAALVDSDDPAVVIDHIAGEGGVSVIAHPAPEHLSLIAGFERLSDGIEAWNSKYDGASAPRPAVFELIRSLQSRKPELLAFYGLDLHWRRQFRGLLNELVVPGDDEASILAALRAGQFTGVTSRWKLPSSGEVDHALLAEFAVLHARSRRFRSVAKGLKKLAGPLGRALPAPIKARLRRFM